MNNKISAYLGFAIKSGKVIFGYDNLKDYNKKLYLIIICHSANNKYIDFSLSKQKTTGCDLLRTKDVLLDQLVNKVNCKIIGIKNKELATAIISCGEENIVEVI